MSVNKVILVGNVGRDPEIRYLDGNSQNGQTTKVATFTLATSDRYRDRNGNLQENTEWHNIVAWRQSADICEKFVKKGTQLFIEGKLRTRSYTDQQGIKKYTTEISVENIQLLGKREISDSGYQGPSQQGGYAEQTKGYDPQQPGFQQPAYQSPSHPASQPSFQQTAYQSVPPEPQQPIGAIDNKEDDLPF